MFGHVEGFVAAAFAHAHEFLGGAGVGLVDLQLPVVHATQGRQIVVGWLAAEDPAEGVAQTGIGLRHGNHALFGEHAGGLDPGRVVQGRKGVQRRAGLARADGAGLAVGRVEHIRGAHRPPPKRIEAAAVEVGAARGGIVEVAFLRDRQRLPDLVGLIGIDGLAADPQVDQTARRERPVAKHQRRHADPARSGVQPVFGILGEVVGRDLARLPVGGARHEQPMHLLLAPALLAKLDRQPVKQTHVPGILALYSHVFSGLHEPRAEELLPHAVHLHAGGQRMLRQEEPAGQTQPIRRRVFRQRRQEGRRSERELLPLRRKVVAAVEDLRLPRLGVAHHHHAGQLVALVVLEGFPRRLIPDHLRQFADDAPLHLAIEETPQLPLDRLGFLGGPLRFRFPQQRRDSAGKILAIGRFAVGKQPRLPGLVGGIDHGLRVALQRLHLRLEFRKPLRVFRGRQFEHRRRHADAGREPARGARLRHAIEHVEQAVIVGLLHRVVFVIVALGAGHRQPQPRRARRVDTVEEVVEPLLFGDRAPLAVQEVIAVEAAGDLLLVGRVRQQVAGQLLDRELVERHVGVEGFHHPVAPDPLPGVAILLKAVGVGVARGIEPGERHPLAVVRARQQPVDQQFVCLRP